MAAQSELDLHDPEDPSADLPLSTDADDDLESDPRPSLDGESQQAPQQPVKRKGGRKPVYATVEERKQRNRQAQAAFRERRTEYIKQLEVTLKQNEQLLQNAQNDQHAVARECNSLRYKISAMEKIMLERGIDVQAELRAKGENVEMATPAYSSMHKPKANALPLPPAESTQYSVRHNARGLAPKLDLRSKMAHLQANQSSPSDAAQPNQAVAWQHASPADVLELSPAASQFRGLPSPTYHISEASFPDAKDYDASVGGFDGRHMAHAMPHSSSYDTSVPMQHDTHVRAPTHPSDDYVQVSTGFNMNGMGKLAHFDYYPNS